MGGKEAVSGFEYQFLRTLEYSLASIASDDSNVTAIRVESAADPTSGADTEIVDFALIGHDENLVVAQVKSGHADRPLTAPDALTVFMRLLEHSARRYLLITNRPASKGLLDLSKLIRDGATDLRESILSLAQRSRLADKLQGADDEFWRRLRCAEVVLDSRTIEQVRDDVREQVRAARHRLAPSTIGWDAAGLLTGHLVWEVLARAAGSDVAQLTTADLADALGTDQNALRGLLVERDWAVHVPAGPRPTDIARPALLDRIAEHLPTPVHGDAAPVCLLTGLSGIGKSSLAAAWADDRADAYAVIFWIDASGPTQIEASFAVVAEWFHAQGTLDDTQGGLPVRERVFAALARIARPWLMVFDNCSDQGTVRDWLPRRGHGHTIVTSTDQTHLAGVNTARVEVTAMTDTEATGLLARRMLGDRKPDANEHQVLGGLAARLHRWPLALELAAAYVIGTMPEGTGDLPRRIAEYDRQLMRSMDDAFSTPLGYPRTVVGAITMTWQRAAGRTGTAGELAAAALRSAAFLASRQIPLHLLLVMWAFPGDVASLSQIPGNLPYYGVDDPPIGEMVRAVRRDSLVSVDEPFMPLLSYNRDPVVPLGYTISMNDIVQNVVRSAVEREGSAPKVLSTIAFHTQAWMTFFTGNHEMGPAVGLLRHGIVASEHALRLDVKDNAVALLWGNTAGILAYLDEWTGAIRYYSAELRYVEKAPQPDLLVRIQTLVSLAAALYHAVERPTEMVDHIILLLERLFADLPTTAEQGPATTARVIRNALNLVKSLRQHSIDHPRITLLESALQDFRRMIPAADKVDLPDEITTLIAMVRADQNVEAHAAAVDLLDRMHPEQAEYPQVLRILVEACVGMRDWTTASSLLSQFVEAARADALSKFDTTAVLRNIGSGCLHAMSEQDEHAFEVFRTVNHIAEIADRHGVAIQAGERDVIAVLRALHAFLNNDVVECIERLNTVDLDDANAVERAGMTKLLHRLLRNWSTDKTRMPESHNEFIPPDKIGDHTFGHSPTPVPDTVLPLDENEITATLVNLGARTALPRAVGATHLAQTSGRPPREPLEVAIETCLALRILGLPAHIVEVTLQILRDGNSVTLGDPQRVLIDNVANAHAVRIPHHAVWVPSSGHLIDAVAPQLHGVRAVGVTHKLHRHPVVIPFPPTNEFPVLRKGGLLYVYTHLGTYEVRNVAATLPTGRQAVCEINAFFTAFRAVFALSATGERFITEVEKVHPELVGLIVKPEQIFDLA